MEPKSKAPARHRGKRDYAAAMTDALVCGAGAAGLASAAMLQRAGVDTVVIESSGEVAASWRTRYAALRLNTPGWMSTQPGYRATLRRYGEYPSRDQWIGYLEDYAAHHGIRPRFDTAVCKVERAGERWQVETNDGTIETRAVVIAVGYDRHPYLPAWPGRETFTGTLMHAADYRDPEPFRGKDVLVVGPGVTGSEVACLISRGGAGRVRVAVRTPPHIVRRKVWGAPVQVSGALFQHLPVRAVDAVTWRMERLVLGDLSRYGLPRPPMGMATLMSTRHQSPAFDDGFVAEVKAGRIEIVSGVVGFSGADVVLADDTRIQPEVVIAATGYRRGLEPIVGHLGVLDGDGRPLVCGGAQHPNAPGLFFCGYRTELSGQLRLMRFDARSIARAVARL
jgi:putative flavoprotein involved in K+ transport